MTNTAIAPAKSAVANFLLARIEEDGAVDPDFAAAARSIIDRYNAFASTEARVVAPSRFTRRGRRARKMVEGHNDIAYGLLFAVRILAQRYADHPDFRASWTWTPVA